MEDRRAGARSAKTKTEERDKQGKKQAKAGEKRGGKGGSFEKRGAVLTGG